VVNQATYQNFPWLHLSAAPTSNYWSAAPFFSRCAGARQLVHPLWSPRYAW
jgi:hypothetical protein